MFVLAHVRSPDYAGAPEWTTERQVPRLRPSPESPVDHRDTGFTGPGSGDERRLEIVAISECRSPSRHRFLFRRHYWDDGEGIPGLVVDADRAPSDVARHETSALRPQR